jgi:hypothetical protein
MNPKYSNIDDLNAEQTSRKIRELNDTVETLRRERDEWKQGQEAALCKVDRLVEQLAAMTADWNLLVKDRDTLTAELAASQAREQQLREALNGVLKNLITADQARSAGMSPSMVDAISVGEAALSILSDDTALRQAKAKVLRDAAAHSSCFDKMQFFVSYINRTADELEGLHKHQGFYQSNAD